MSYVHVYIYLFKRQVLFDYRDIKETQFKGNTKNTQPGRLISHYIYTIIFKNTDLLVSKPDDN